MMSNFRLTPDVQARGFWFLPISLALAIVLAFSALILPSAPALADTSPPASVPPTVTSDPLPTAQIDGVAWSQAVSGDTVFVGGEFATARPPGAAAGVNTSPRANLMSYDLTSGALLPWNPGANGAVKTVAVSPDGKTLYVGGQFTQIAGQTRYRLAAFNTATGALLPWAPSPNASVQSLVASDTTVWVVGGFSSFGSSARPRVAAVNATSGALLPFTANVAGGWDARGVVVSPDYSKIVIVGSFTSVNGSTNPGRGMAALDSVSGASLPWLGNSVLRNAGNNAGMYSVSSDSDSVYVVGYDFGGSKTEDGFEGAARLSWSDGTLVWMQDCHGDSYASFPMGEVLYVVTHAHYCGNVEGGFPQTTPWTFYRAMAWNKAPGGTTVTSDPYGYRSFTGQPAGKALHWYPSFDTGTYTGQGQAAWAVTSAGDYLLLGGEFTRAAGKLQQGLVRFATKEAVGQPKMGPRIDSSKWPLSAYSVRSGQVRLNWQANWDFDNEKLSYALYRQGTTDPIYTVDMNSRFDKLPAMNFKDDGLNPGQEYRYRVVVTDPDGNKVTGAWTPVTVADSNSASSYDDAVLSDGAVHYWPMGDSSSTSAMDWADGTALTLTGVTPQQTGPNQAKANAAMSFSGNTSSFGASTTPEPGRNTLSLEAWFKTSSSSGGKIVGFGNSSTGNSGSYDRHIYINGQGKVSFGVYPGATRTVASGNGFNNGQWHHVVGTLGSNGMALYLDGKLVGTRTDTVSGQQYDGVWRVGGDNVNSWPDAGANYLNGTISNVAVYDKVLSRSAVDRHWVESGRTSTLPPAPSDSYGKSVFEAEPTLYWRLNEASGNTATDAGMNGTSGRYYGGNNVTYGVIGAITGVSNKAVSLAPTKNWLGQWAQTGVSSTQSFVNPNVFSLETWFRTTSTTGGKILGFGSSSSGASSSYDRHIYMSADGRVKFGVDSGGQKVIQSSAGFNDGGWHHVAATLSGSGMELYLDGELVATNPAVSAGGNYTGYWRVGGDNGWEGDTYWKGAVDEVAVYPSVLAPDVVRAHYQLGDSGRVNTPPVAQFSALVTDSTVAFDAAASSDTDGSIASYAWDFGDGIMSTAASPTHEYEAPGVYEVSLTVTDNEGASGQVSQQVTIHPPNVVPVAEFAATGSWLSVAFDASASSDPDGSVAAYAWDFGDGGTGEGVTASHEYAAAGTYTVTLTVTDNRGGTATKAYDVTVEAPPSGVLAQDGFDRAVSNGWGSADLGGAWALSGPATGFSVADSAGVFTLRNSTRLQADLPSVSSSSTVLSASFSVDKVANAHYVHLIGRQVGAEQYLLRARIAADGSVQLYVMRGGTVIGAAYTVPGLVVTPGTSYSMRFQVDGVSPTALSGKMWKSSEAEPGWQVVRSDAAAALQGPGSVGLYSWVGAGSNAYPLAVAFGDVTVATP